jgi:dTDP-4-amino-4,6-dideoxygalactose transaminase
VGCFSTHPLKNFNSVGDGGFMVTNKKSIYDRARKLRNHGTKDRNVIDEFGYVSRLDTIQAVVLDYRLKRVNGLIKKRRKNASLYRKYLTKKIFIPHERKDEFNTYHTFVVQTSKRDQLKKYLIKKGIETAIHYPIPIHLQPSAKKIGHKVGDFIKTEEQSKRILTLPIHQYLKKSDIFKISQIINNFFEKYE